MLTWIDLRHFKCFERLRLPLRPLTLLTGPNASGKSSVMQALVLLHQTMREHEWSSRLMLNGASIRLGTVADVIDQIHGRRSCEIGLLDGDQARFDWEFEGERHEMSMALRWVHGNAGAGDDWEVLGAGPFHRLLPAQEGPVPLPLFQHPEIGEIVRPVFLSLTERLCGLTYLTAERLGPREQYLFDDPQLTPVVGPRGEYAVSVLHSGRDLPVLDRLADQDVAPTRFRQVEARMARFFPGCVLAIEPVPHANSATLGIRLTNDMEFQRPVHIGFGLTQVLPIVVAALSANEHDLLLIENPEVHLHPAGQAAMGGFLAEVAAAGVQVLIETHSDHVLNGIRRAVKSGMLTSDDIALHFFRPRRAGGEEDGPQVQSPTLDANGNIDDWPDGFFDQFDKDMNYFAGWS